MKRYGKMRSPHCSTLRCENLVMSKMTEFATINTIKRLVRDRRMDRGARLGVNQGEAEGVYDCTRPRISPQICPQDCPRGAAAGRLFLRYCTDYSLRSSNAPQRKSPDAPDLPHTHSLRFRLAPQLRHKPAHSLLHSKFIGNASTTSSRISSLTSSSS